MEQKIKVEKAKPDITQLNHADLPEGTFYESPIGDLCIKIKNDYGWQHNTLVFCQGKVAFTWTPAKSICYPVEKINITYAFKGPSWQATNASTNRSPLPEQSSSTAGSYQPHTEHSNTSRSEGGTTAS